MSKHFPTLYSTYKLGSLELKNRIVMAPMTRSRAIGNLPNELMATYYAQRAEAGLIISEGVSPSPNGLGYSRIPGLYNEAQVQGWKQVTDAVHAKNGKIFVQLMHTGRISHQLNLPEGGKVVGASPIAAATTQMWTDQEQMKPLPVPEEIMDVPALIQEYVQSAKLAITAGFDGVEIHAANGYLPMQFLNLASNNRNDNYGGGPENRNRFVIELAKEMAAAIGKDKVGIRLSPFNKYNDMDDDGTTEAQYIALADGLAEADLVYVHFINVGIPDTVLDAYRNKFKTVMLNGGYNAEKAEADISDDKAQLISFGSSFIANPDLVTRFQNGETLISADPGTFFTADEVGYTDYAVPA